MIDFRPIWVDQTLLLIRPGLVVTNLPDGGLVYAKPHDTEEYRERAQELGYASGAEMNAEHDACHVLISHWLKEPACPVLSAVSRGEEWEHAGEREAMVLAFQKTLNDPSAFEPGLLVLVNATGRSVRDLVSEARRVLRGE